MGCSSGRGVEAPGAHMAAPTATGRAAAAASRSQVPTVRMQLNDGHNTLSIPGVNYRHLLGALNEKALQDAIENSKTQHNAERRARATASLPTEQYNSEHHKDLVECELCLEDYVHGDELLRLPCMHAFHCKCVKPWLLKSGICPTCRTDLESGEVQ